VENENSRNKKQLGKKFSIFQKKKLPEEIRRCVGLNFNPTNQINLMLFHVGYVGWVNYSKQD